VQRRMLGRTGLEVGVAGLGCGGHSRLGTRTGRSFDESVDLVRSALDLGIDYVDTAASYGTEEIVGAAVAGRRDGVVLSTKAMPFRPDRPPLTAVTLRESVQASLRRLRTDVVDVFHLHGVDPGGYDYCVAELVPELFSLRDRGVIRFLAVAEVFVSDPGHLMLERAVHDDCWDVVMVGFNIVNQSARDRVFQHTQSTGVGVEVMFAVRRALGDPAALRATVARLIDDGRLDPSAIDRDDPLGFLVHEGGAASMVDAAYRFARHEPGCQVVLTGTGSIEHLRDNIRSLNSAPLPALDRERLMSLFGDIDNETGD
jgi:aryl-alcohol dehydrogenase-like predicted oxidoreductase